MAHKFKRLFKETVKSFSGGGGGDAPKSERITGVSRKAVERSDLATQIGGEEASELLKPRLQGFKLGGKPVRSALVGGKFPEELTSLGKEQLEVLRSSFTKRRETIQQRRLQPGKPDVSFFLGR